MSTTASLSTTGIVLEDGQAKQKNRGMCTSSQPSRVAIPFHQVLWLEPGKEKDEYTLAYCNKDGKKCNYTPHQTPVKFKTHEEGLVEQVLAKAYPGDTKRQKRLLVLINPHGGQGKANQIFHASCEPILKAAQCKYTVQVTTHRYHATEIALDLNIDDYDGIVCCSGDGIPHEVINGFLQRKEDSVRALTSIPICQLPCGSGNSMAVSLNGNPSPSNAALCIVKGRPMPVDLMSFNQGDKTVLSFLSQTYGIVADADLGTESMRWMGASRFVVGTIMRALSQKSYPCEIYVKYAYETKEHVTQHFNRQVKNQSNELAVDLKYDKVPPLRFGTTNDPVPQDWTKLERSKLAIFYVGKMPWMSADALVFPATLPTDGMLDMVTWDSTLGRIKALDMLTKMGQGHHFHAKYINYSKVEGYRLVPKINDGFLSIDGESFPFEPFQVEVVPRLGCLLSATGEYAKTHMHPENHVSRN